MISKYATFWYPLQEINSEIDVISFEANFLEYEERLYSIKNHEMGIVASMGQRKISKSGGTI